MTNATMQRHFNPSRSPLLGVAAVLATAMTMGAAILLPAQHAPAVPSAPAITAAQPADAQPPTQVVNLPAIEVVGTRSTKSAENAKWNQPAVFKEKG